MSSRARGIRKVAGYAQLEDAFCVRGRIALAKAGRGDRCTLLLDPRRALTPRELFAELRSKRGAGGSRADEHHACGRWRLGNRGRKRDIPIPKAACDRDRVQQCEQPAPGIADERERLQRQLSHECRQILDVRLPRDRSAVLGSRSPAAALVVEDQPIVARELEHLRQEIIVRRTRTAVRNEQPRCVLRTVRGVKKLHDYGCNATAGVL